MGDADRLADNTVLFRNTRFDTLSYRLPEVVPDEPAEALLAIEVKGFRRQGDFRWGPTFRGAWSTLECGRCRLG